MKETTFGMYSEGKVWLVINQRIIVSIVLIVLILSVVQIVLIVSVVSIFDLQLYWTKIELIQT